MRRLITVSCATYSSPPSVRTSASSGRNVTEDGHYFSWEGMMSLLIRYAHIPFYFHFSFTFSTSLIHHYTPLLRCNRTQSHSLHWTNRTYLMDIWLTIHMYLLLFLVSPTCPLLRSNQSQVLAPRGQALSITLPYAHFLVFHLYLTCLYLPFAREHHHRNPNQLPIWVSPRIEI